MSSKIIFIRFSKLNKGQSSQNVAHFAYTQFKANIIFNIQTYSMLKTLSQNKATSLKNNITGVQDKSRRLFFDTTF